LIARENVSEADTGARGSILCEICGSAARDAAEWLRLAAAPTFLVMALLTGVLGGGRMAMMCSGLRDSSPLTGMAPMYLLMSAFHSAPWLKLISGGQRGARFRQSREADIADAGAGQAQRKG
jgi:hypothetical protein